MGVPVSAERRGRVWREIMIMVETSPVRQETAVRVNTSLKRSHDRDSSMMQESKVKKPRYVGTIYEAMLAPLAPSTTLPVSQVRTVPHQPRGDPGLQADLLDLVKLGKKEKMEEWLEENGECVNLNIYSSEGLTPLHEVCQDGGENSTELAKLLVRFGADTRLASRDGWSPIHMASFNGNSALLLFLLSCRS